MKRYVIKSETIRRISLAILLTSFVIFFFSDGISKILYRSDSDFHRYSRIIKAIFTFIILIYGTLTLNRTKADILICIVLLTLSFFVGQFFLGQKLDDVDIVENSSTLFKYLFPFIYFFLVSDVLKFDEFPKIIKETYYRILAFNNVLIIVGLITGAFFLTTYKGPWRFGYDGLIFAQNEASFVFIFAITTVYYRRFYLGIKEWMFWIVLLPSILVATKGIFLYLIVLALFHILIRVSLVKVLGILAGLLTFVYILLNSFINEILLNSYAVFMYMYNKGGLLFALLSGRDQFINEKLVPLISGYWVFPNYIFGGQEVKDYYIEMGFFDLFLFFGLFGCIIYLYVFYRIFSLIPFERKFKIFFALSLLVIIATAGHFFESGIAGLHFLLMLLIIHFSIKQKNQEMVSKPK